MMYDIKVWIVIIDISDLLLAICITMEQTKKHVGTLHM